MPTTAVLQSQPHRGGEDPGRVQALVGQVGQQQHGGERDQQRRAPKQPERGDRVGLRPAERAPLARIQALRKQRHAQHEVEHRDRAGDEQRNLDPEGAEQPAGQRTDDEADPERRPDHPVTRGAVLVGRDVGDVGVDRVEDRPQDAGDAEAHDVPREARADRQGEVGDRRADHAQDQHRLTSHLVAQRPQHRRADEAETSGQGRDQTGQLCRPAEVAVDEAPQQLRQHRNQHPHRRDVDEQGAEDQRHLGTLDHLSSSERNITILFHQFVFGTEPFRSSDRVAKHASIWRPNRPRQPHRSADGGPRRPATTGIF